MSVIRYSARKFPSESVTYATGQWNTTILRLKEETHPPVEDSNILSSNENVLIYGIAEVRL